MKKIAISLCLLVGLTSCGPQGPIPVIKGAVVDCLGANRPKIDSTIEELKAKFVNRSVEWSFVYERGKTLGSAVGGCVIAELVQFYLGGFGGPIDNGWEAHEVLEKFRTEEAGGASFQTTCKKTDGTSEVCKL